jgi:hypothetical protein
VVYDIAQHALVPIAPSANIQIVTRKSDTLLGFSKERLSRAQSSNKSQISKATLATTKSPTSLCQSACAIATTAPTMPFFVNPFRRESVENFPGVLVPLEQAHRHISATTVQGQTVNKSDASTPTDDTNIKATSKDETGIGRTSSANYTPYTVEGLRAEVMEDIAASGHDTSYDREFPFSCSSS